MEAPAPPTISAQLVHVGKLITDTDELLQIMLRRPRQSKPWQRQFVTQLREAERNVQVLRMTISLERASTEILDAGNALKVVGRRMSASMSRSRADITTLQAIQLLMHLTDAVDQALKDMAPAFPPIAPPSPEPPVPQTTGS